LSGPKNAIRVYAFARDPYCWRFLFDRKELPMKTARYVFVRKVLKITKEIRPSDGPVNVIGQMVLAANSCGGLNL
jgi:hypothetical protein